MSLWNDSVSSDLFSRRFELKFTISTSMANEIRDWAIQRMDPDPFIASTGSDEYKITSLYLDTPELGIFHRSPDTTARKFRLRRYGCDSTIWLEGKRKKGDLVRKRRSSIAEQDLHSVAIDAGTRPAVAEDDSCSDESNSHRWFLDRIHRYRLQPSTWIEYGRFARVGYAEDMGSRLTIDRSIKCLSARDWFVPVELGGSASELTTQEQLELKFCDRMPNGFKQLMREFDLTRSVLSKYRSSVNICYLVTPRSRAS